MKGFCVWFTGLPASGKSTNARNLLEILQKENYSVEILDGDDLRRKVSRDLGFSRQDRDLHVGRAGELAAERVRAGKVVLCALVSPYRAARDHCRWIIGLHRFVEVFVEAPLAECERRDPKGLYAKARQGRIRHFTGVSDPYECPLTPDVVLNTWVYSPDQNARRMEAFLARKGFLPWR